MPGMRSAIDTAIATFQSTVMRCSQCAARHRARPADERPRESDATPNGPHVVGPVPLVETGAARCERRALRPRANKRYLRAPTAQATVIVSRRAHPKAARAMSFA